MVCSCENYVQFSTPSSTSRSWAAYWITIACFGKSRRAHVHVHVSARTHLLDKQTFIFQKSGGGDPLITGGRGYFPRAGHPFSKAPPDDSQWDLYSTISYGEQIGGAFLSAFLRAFLRLFSDLL